MMKRYDYQPMTFELHPHRWLEIAMRMPEHIKNSIIRRISYDLREQMVFQSDMEKIMYFLAERGMLYQKAELQGQINSHIYKGDWK